MILITNDGSLQLGILVWHMQPNIYLTAPANTVTLQNSTDGKRISIYVLRWSSKESEYSAEAK